MGGQGKPSEDVVGSGRVSFGDGAPRSDADVGIPSLAHIHQQHGQQQRLNTSSTTSNSNAQLNVLEDFEIGDTEPDNTFVSSHIYRKGLPLDRRSTAGSTGGSFPETTSRETSTDMSAPFARHRGGSRRENPAETDESAPIIRHPQDSAQDYKAISPSIAARTTATEGVNGVGGSSVADRLREQQRRDEREAQRAAAETERSEKGKWKAFVEKYGSVELENKGSVARDHLALERTFLAWLRTSLSFASIGIAVTQLFRLNTSIAHDGTSPAAQARLRHVGKPLGATFIAISIVILFIGFHRYFEAQHYVIRGKFPASRGSVLIVSFVAGALIISSLVVVLAIAPKAFEK